MSKPLRLAILDEQLPAQFRERPREAEGLEVVWSGIDAEELVRATGRADIDIIVADLARLGPDPAESAERLLESSGAELFITVYHFAPRLDVERLAGPNRKLVKAPVSLPALKAQMMSSIVRGLLGTAAVARTTRSPAPASARSSAPVELPGGRPRYSDAQLGALRERQSRLACECPNHVAELVTSLVAFERYSRSCAARDDADAAMHRELADATAAARRTMETALSQLLRFENIEV